MSRLATYAAGLLTVGDQIAVSLAPVRSHLCALEVLMADFAAFLPGGRLPHVDDAALRAACIDAARDGIAQVHKDLS